MNKEFSLGGDDTGGGERENFTSILYIVTFPQRIYIIPTFGGE